MLCSFRPEDDEQTATGKPQEVEVGEGEHRRPGKHRLPVSDADETKAQHMSEATVSNNGLIGESLGNCYGQNLENEQHEILDFLIYFFSSLSKSHAESL